MVSFVVSFFKYIVYIYLNFTTGLLFLKYFDTTLKHLLTSKSAGGQMLFDFTLFPLKLFNSTEAAAERMNTKGVS